MIKPFRKINEKRKSLEQELVWTKDDSDKRDTRTIYMEKHA